MNDLLASVSVCLALLLMFAVVQVKLSGWERPWVLLSLVAHVFAAYVQVNIVHSLYGGIADLLGYHQGGILLAQLLHDDLLDGTARLLLIVLNQDDIAIPLDVGPGSTGAMMGISGFAMAIVSDSLYAGCMLIAGLSTFAKLGVYRLLRREFKPELHRLLLIGTLLVPSVVFWSSALMKEAVAIIGISVAAYFGYHLRRFPLLGPVGLLFGLTLAGAVKPYTLIGFGAGAAAWVFLDGARQAERRRTRTLTMPRLLLGAGFAAIIVIIVGEIFPRFAPENLGQEAARMQSLVEGSEGASDYAIGDAERTTLTGQLVFAPIAIATSLFRPLIFEARNAQMAVNALETTTLTVLVFAVIFRLGAARTVRAIMASPALTFCAVYTLVLAVGVGLATTNLGTLSRYRMPFMPFYAALVLVLASKRFQVGVPAARPVVSTS